MISFSVVWRNLRNILHPPIVTLEGVTIERKDSHNSGRLLVNGHEYLRIEGVPRSFGDDLHEASKKFAGEAI